MSDMNEILRVRDPIDRLFYDLKAFVLDAIEQENVPVGRFNERTTIAAGTLYKWDGDFIKIHLSPPGEDLSFDDPAPIRPKHKVNVPDTWVRVPIPHAESLRASDLDFDDLEAIITDAPEIIVYSQIEGVEPFEFSVRGMDFGHESPSSLNLYASKVENIDMDQINETYPINRQEQNFIAMNWLQILPHLALRTIGDFNRPTAASA